MRRASDLKVRGAVAKDRAMQQARARQDSHSGLEGALLKPVGATDL